MSQVTKHVYLKVWQNKHIHEVKTHNHKTCPKKMGIQVKMHESSKLDYTSTSNGYI